MNFRLWLKPSSVTALYRLGDIFERYMCKIQNTLFLLLHDLVLECFYHLEQDQADEAGDDKDTEKYKIVLNHNEQV